MKPWLIVLLIALLLFLTISFFWKENLTCASPINYAKYAAYFTSIGAIATATTLFLLFRQVQIMNMANRLANFPDLSINNYSFRLVGEPVSNDEKTGKLLSYYYAIANSEDPMNQLPAFFTLYNDGNSSARKVEGKWLFDRDQVKQITKGYSVLMPHMEKNNTFESDILTPRDKIAISIPNEYFQIHAPEYNSETRAGSNQRDSYVPFEKKSKLKLELTYFNNGKQKFNKIFSTQITVFDSNVNVSFKLESES